MKPKYITFFEVGVLQMVIFPETMVHAQVARRLCGVDHVVSAGFIQIIADKDEPIYAYGESESLNVRSAPEDTDLARALFLLS